MMKILKLSIKNHNRITLGTREIEYIPNKKIGVLLGDNGSGKSTMLGLLFPRVVKLDELDNNGYVKLKLLESDRTIEISTIKSSRTYHFIVDGTEMNPKSSVRLQEELIKEYIRINKDIHDILTGSLRFTQTSVKHRRDVLELLSGNDYSYINDLYKHINRQYMDKRAILSHTDERLAEAEENLKNLEKDNETHDVDIKEARESLETLLELSNTSARGIDLRSLERRLEGSEYILERYKSSYKSLLRNAKKFPIGSYEKMDNWKVELDKKIVSLSSEIKVLTDRHLELTERGVDDEDHYAKLDSIRSKIDKNDKKRQSIPTSALKLLDGVDDIRSLERHLSIYKFKLREISEIPLEYFKLPQIDETIIESNKLKLISLNRGKDKIEQDLIFLDNLAKEDNLECPKCGNEFKQGYDKNKHAKLVVYLDSILEEIDILDKHTKELIKDYDAWQIAESARSTFRSFVNDLPISLQDNFKEGFPETVQSKLLSMVNAISHRIYYDELTRSILTDKEQLQRLESIDIDEMKRLAKEASVLEDRIKYLTNGKRTLSKISNEVDTVINSRDKYHRAGENLTNATRDLEEVINLRKEYLFQVYLDKEIVKARDRYYKLENIDVRIARYTMDIESIKFLLSKLSPAVEAYKKVVGILHPKGKYIARSIIGFLNIFIEAINEHIAKVWTYPVELDTLETDSGVSYRLSFKADGKHREDISCASTATADMMDIAIKLAVMDTLGMEGYPVYLDELGSGYDSEHSKALCGLIEELSRDSRYSNLFIVSNDADVSRYLRNMDGDVVILSDNNIVA